MFTMAMRLRPETGGKGAQRPWCAARNPEGEDQAPKTSHKKDRRGRGLW